MSPLRLALDARGAAANWIIRVLVGAVFFAEGVQKFLFPATLGVGRFQHIGIPMPEITAPFVGVVEIIFGLLVAIGLVTRLASTMLLIDILVAIATTKVPMLLSKGFWPTVHEARTDWAMLLGLVFLLVAGAGPRSFDRKLQRVARRA